MRFVGTAIVVVGACYATSTTHHFGYNRFPATVLEAVTDLTAVIMIIGGLIILAIGLHNPGSGRN